MGRLRASRSFLPYDGAITRRCHEFAQAHDREGAPALEAFKHAIDGERDAQAEYGRMAALAEDPEVRAVFEVFQREEGKHEEQLAQLYAEFKARFVPE